MITLKLELSYPVYLFTLLLILVLNAQETKNRTSSIYSSLWYRVIIEVWLKPDSILFYSFTMKQVIVDCTNRMDFKYFYVRSNIIIEVCTILGSLIFLFSYNEMRFVPYKFELSSHICVFTLLFLLFLIAQEIINW